MKYIMNVLCHRLVFKFTLINAFSILIIALAFPANLVTFNLSSVMGFEQERESRDTMANQSSLKQLTNPTSVQVDPHTLHIHDNDDTVGYHSRKVHSDTGIETENKNNWITVNHDIYSTRSSNQTIISKENVSQLKVKWTLFNDVEIQDPPIIIGNKGFVQDNSGAVIAFDTVTGKVLWKSKIGSGPTMGLTFNNGRIYAATAYRATVVAINATDGKIIWESRALGNPKTGYNIPTYPIVWKDYVIVGSAGGGDVSSGVGTVRGNITALNGTNGKIIWNLPTTTGEWVNPSTAPSYNSGANDWSGGSLDPETGILYMPLGSASPNFNATTRQEGDLYSNHMMAINITNGQIIWATPFIAAGTVLDVTVPDTHDWDTSWGSSISTVTYDNGTQAKIVIGHDKMGNIIAMNAATGREIWWKLLGRQHNTDATPKPDGSGDIWSYGIFNYHAVDSENTMYIAATNRGLNYFTDSGLAGHRLSAPHTIELGLRNGTIAALDLRSGKLKWELPMEFPPRVSPLVTNGIVFTGYIHFTEKTRSNHHVSTTKSGIILALGKENGQKLWQYNINAEIGQVGPSIGNGMLFVPTDKIQIQSKNSSRQGGSILAFGLP
jgi:alcohol dehydrogenase (cytochrome c)